MNTHTHQSTQELCAENADLYRRIAELEREAAVGRTLMQHFPLGIIATFDHDLRYTEAYWTTEERGNLSRATLVGRTLHEVMPSDLSATLEPYYRAALDGTAGRVTVTFADANYDVHILPVCNESGRVLCGLAISYDMTARLTAEERLRESEEQFRTLSASAQDAIVMIDNDGFICFWNSAAERLLGYSSPEALGQDLHRLIVPERLYEDYRRGMAVFRNTGQGPAIGHTVELEALHKDGTLCPVEVSLSAVQMRGSWYGIGILRDISERKQAEQALRESEDRFRTAAEAGLDAFMILQSKRDASGKIVDFLVDYVNKHTEHMLSMSRDNLLGQHICELFPINRTNGFFEQYAQVVETNTPLVQEFDIPGDEHAPGWYRHQVVPLADGVAISMEDISERKRAEQALRESQRLLQTLIDHIPATVFVKDTNLRYLLVNRYFAQLIGLLPEQMVGRTNQEVLSSMEEQGLISSASQLQMYRQIIATWYREDQDVLLNGRHIETEDMAWIEGNLRSFIAHKFPLYDQHSDIIGLGGISTDITERKQMEAAVRESEEKYRLLSENSRDMICLHDPDGTYRYVSQGVKDLLGYTPDELLGTSPYDLFHPEDWEHIQQNSHQVATEGGLATIEYRIRHKSGEYIWFDTRTRPIHDDSGAVVQLQTTSRDISERKQAEAALRESQTRLQAIFDNALLGVGLMDLQWNYLKINNRWAEMLGYTPQEVYQGRALDVTHPDDRAVSHLHQQKLAKGKIDSYRLEKRFIRKDGSTFWSDVLVTLIRDERGQPAFIVGTVADISERKQAEEEMHRLNETLKRQSAELRESQGLLRGFLDHSPTVMLAKNLQGQVILYNKQFQHFWNASQSMLYTNSRSFLPTEYASIIEAQDQQVARTGRPLEQEVHIPQNEKLLTYMRVVFPIKDDEGHIYAIGSIATDVTERKQAEKDLQQVNDTLNARAHDLERHNQEITLLSDMSDLLQTCRADSEAAAVIQQMMPLLFPGLSGALYTIAASRTHGEAVAMWGDLIPQHICDPEECWALRRGKMHLVQDIAGEHALVCKHLSQPLPQSTFCMPMMAQGETIGMLHLCRKQGDLPEAMQKLAVTVAEHISLSLANMRLRETLRHQAIRDPLTGLYNRRYMEESLEREIRRATRHHTTLGVIMLDLDHFKQFNDTFGHAAGDTLLRELGSVLKTYLRGEDIACRYGGEEFTLIILDANFDAVVGRAEQIRNAVTHLSVMYRGQSLGAVTLSLGVALFPTHGTTGEALVRVADQALYQAKASGRDRVMVAQADAEPN
jgi:diguanylate cyclase (GGDEF)-like protein/PAS domain S-box-containing protein